MNKKAIALANSTSRSRGAVGARAITPKYVEKIASKFDIILDYGAGKDAIHTKRLIKKGYNVIAHDFGDNYVEGVHHLYALCRRYNIVYASNVLNVQSSRAMLIATIKEIYKVLCPGGIAVFNYPARPRYTNITTIELVEIIKRVFGSTPNVVGGTSSAPLFDIQK